MKRKLFLTVIILTIFSSGLFADTYKKIYEKKDVYKDIFIYMYEVYNNEELIYYRIDTKQRPNFNKYIKCNVICENKNKIMKLLSGLADCYNNDYYKYLSDYPDINFLSEEYNINEINTITEKYCYEIQ